MRWQTEIKDTVGRHHRGPLFNAWAKPKGTGQQFSPLFTTWRCLATQPTPLARPHHARVGVDARVDRLLPTLAFGVVGLPFVPMLQSNFKSYCRATARMRVRLLSCRSNRIYPFLDSRYLFDVKTLSCLLVALATDGNEGIWETGARRMKMRARAKYLWWMDFFFEMKEDLRLIEELKWISCSHIVYMK